jgi:hypothetical protein
MKKAAVEVKVLFSIIIGFYLLGRAKPSRCASFRATFRARLMASALRRTRFSEGFS